MYSTCTVNLIPIFFLKLPFLRGLYFFDTLVLASHTIHRFLFTSCFNASVWFSFDFLFFFFRAKHPNVNAKKTKTQPSTSWLIVTKALLIKQLRSRYFNPIYFTLLSWLMSPQCACRHLPVCLSVVHFGSICMNLPHFKFIWKSDRWKRTEWWMEGE